MIQKINPNLSYSESFPIFTDDYFDFIVHYKEEKATDQQSRIASMRFHSEEFCWYELDPYNSQDQCVIINSLVKKIKDKIKQQKKVLIHANYLLVDCIDSGQEKNNLVVTTDEIYDEEFLYDLFSSSLILKLREDTIQLGESTITIFKNEMKNTDADITVVYLEEDKNIDYQNQAHQLIDRGAEIVICNSMLNHQEIYKGKLIVYRLGILSIDIFNRNYVHFYLQNGLPPFEIKYKQLEDIPDSKLDQIFELIENNFPNHALDKTEFLKKKHQTWFWIEMNKVMACCLCVLEKTLWNLATRKSLQEKNMATELMKFVLEYYQHGALELNVNKQDDKIIQFYEKLGFQVLESKTTEKKLWMRYINKNKNNNEL